MKIIGICISKTVKGTAKGGKNWKNQKLNEKYIYYQVQSIGQEWIT